MSNRRLMARWGMAAILVSSSMLAAADEQDSIDYRQHVMKTLEAQTTAISLILQHKGPAENLATHAKILSLSAGTAKLAFEPKAAGGNAEPQVWTSWADFSKQMDALVSAADDLVKASSNPAAAAAKQQAVMATCKSCHDQYLAPKK